MTRWIILAVLVVAITTAATVAVQYMPVPSSPGNVAFPAASSKPGPKPLAVVDGSLTHEFGMAAQHVKIEKDWKIKNEGQGDLVITKGVVACTCTVAEFAGDKDRESLTLKPGEETTLHLTFDTRDFNGAYHKTASFLTNDPLHPSIEFVADGTVRPSVVLYPPEPTINYLEVSNDLDDHPSSILLYSPDKPDIKITELVSSRPNLIVVKDEPMPEDDCKMLKVERGHRLTVDVKGSMPLGLFREEVLIKTDHPKQPEVRITVSGKMVGPISASPDRMRLVPVHSSVGKQGELMLTVRGLRPTRFEVERKPDKIDVSIAPSDPASRGGQYLLKVSVPPGMKPGLILDQIVLKTDHPKANEIKIPLDVSIQSD